MIQKKYIYPLDFSNPALCAEMKLRILPFIKKTASGCWEWTKCVQANGYARIRLGSKTQYAHRIAYSAFTGVSITSDMFACHKCDNPRCVNPEHIFIGNHADNTADARAKGRLSNGDKHARLVCGERGGGAKLTWKKVSKIRALSASGVRTKAIAARYGVDVSTVRLVLRNKTWKSGWAP